MTPIEIVGVGTSAGAALNNLFRLVEGLKRINDRIKLNAAIFEIQQELIKANAAYADEVEKRKAAVERADALEKKLLEAENFACESKLYKPLSPCLGITVYQYAEPPQEGKCRAWYCPCCFGNKKLHLLQAVAEIDGRAISRLDVGFKCPECGFSFVMLHRVARELLG